MSRKPEFTPDFGTAVRDIDSSYEPDELRNPVPWPFIAIALALAVWGGATIYLDDRSTGIGHEAQLARRAVESGSAPAEATDAEVAQAEGDHTIAQGAALFGTYCATCHQANGAGVRGAIPPLDGSRYVVADAEVPVAIVLRGISGPIEVRGEVYAGRMPTFHPVLDDEDIALILTHVRGSWSNDAAPVASAVVAAVRGALADDLARPWEGGAEIEEAFGIPTVIEDDAADAGSPDAPTETEDEKGPPDALDENATAPEQRAATAGAGTSDPEPTR